MPSFPNLSAGCPDWEEQAPNRTNPTGTAGAGSNPDKAIIRPGLVKVQVLLPPENSTMDAQSPVSHQL